jgi:hypothetical protein
MSNPMVVAGWGKAKRRVGLPLFQGAKFEVALALVLWRNLRLTYTARNQGLGRGDDFLHLTDDCERVNNRALRMAKRLGVAAEYLDLVLTTPVTRIYFKEFEEWTNLPDSARRQPPVWVSSDSGSKPGPANGSASPPKPKPSKRRRKPGRSSKK